MKPLVDNEEEKSSEKRKTNEKDEDFEVNPIFDDPVKKIEN